MYLIPIYCEVNWRQSYAFSFHSLNERKRNMLATPVTDEWNVILHSRLIPCNFLWSSFILSSPHSVSYFNFTPTVYVHTKSLSAFHYYLLYFKSLYIKINEVILGIICEVNNGEHVEKYVFYHWLGSHIFSVVTPIVLLCYLCQHPKNHSNSIKFDKSCLLLTRKYY